LVGSTQFPIDRTTIDDREEKNHTVVDGHPVPLHCTMEIDAYIESIETTGRATNQIFTRHAIRGTRQIRGLHCTQEKSTRLIWQPREEHSS